MNYIYQSLFFYRGISFRRRKTYLSTRRVTRHEDTEYTVQYTVFANAPCFIFLCVSSQLSDAAALRQCTNNFLVLGGLLRPFLVQQLHPLLHSTQLLFQDAP